MFSGSFGTEFFISRRRFEDVNENPIFLGGTDAQPIQIVAFLPDDKEIFDGGGAGQVLRSLSIY